MTIKKEIHNTIMNSQIQLQKENQTYQEGLRDGYELHKKEIIKLVDGYPKYIYKKDLMKELEGE